MKTGKGRNSEARDSFKELGGLSGPSRHLEIKQMEEKRWNPGIDVGGEPIMGNVRVQIMASDFYSDGHSLGKDKGTWMLGSLSCLHGH